MMIFNEPSRPFLHKYIKLLHKFQFPLLTAQIMIGIIRIFTQSLFSFISTLSLIQPLLVSFIVSNHLTPQCQIYIIIAVILCYTLIINQISWISDWKTTEFNSSESFRFHYRNWGYWIEIVVRIAGIIIVWKSYCLSKILEDYGYDYEEAAESEETS